MNLGFLLLVLFLFLVVGALPTWPHSRNWGYYPSGSFGLVLVILIFLVITSRI